MGQAQVWARVNTQYALSDQPDAMHFNLRTKGVLTLAVLILYISSVGLFLTNERQKLVAIVQEIDTNSTAQSFFGTLLNALGHTLVDIQAILSSPEFANARPALVTQSIEDLTRIAADLQQTAQMYSLLAPDSEDFNRELAAIKNTYDFGHLAKIRDIEQRLIAKLNDVLGALRMRGEDSAQRYHELQQFINVVSIAGNIFGAVVSAAVILMFFGRLAKDIKRLQARAIAVVGGYDGGPLSNTRHDEIGGLIEAVNRMQVDLRRSERQQEISRQQRFHQEKMAAVGSLAAAIGHEVSNPIAAISGVAQQMIEETKDDNRASSKICHEFATQMLQQAERIALIMRQMSTLTTPHSPEAELLDLNALIESTCGFIAYDARFAGVTFEQDLDRDIPAITAVADHITQILMNVLINAADAMDPASQPGQRRIQISTRVAGDNVHLSVTDNGLGMSPEVLAKAFDESFTTKPAGKGRGIGLFLCKALVKKDGGRIELTSTLGVGTSLSLFLSLSPAVTAVRAISAPFNHASLESSGH
jgi:signal transduction histidine kinase